MKIKRTSAAGKFDFPAPMYFIAKVVHDFPYVADILHRLESSAMRSQITKMKIRSPAFVTGLARAGTTIVLEMLSQHPEFAAHRYLHMVLPYAPAWFQKFADLTPIMLTPSERLHKDGLMVTRDSPEAVEEVFWQKYFESITDETQSNVLTKNTCNPKFERFYKENMKKLILNQNATRYLTKNNYNVSRMEYILKLFPDAKFILLIRNPFDHIASLAKQDRVLSELESGDSRLLDWTKIIGHREFGSEKICINFDNTERVEKIRNLWSKRESYVAGWAEYWASVYEFVMKSLRENRQLSDAVLVVRYEDLCDSPGNVIDEIINHLQLDSTSFSEIKEYYRKKLRRPAYYKTEYSDEEREDILNASQKIAEEFGYNL